MHTTHIYTKTVETVGLKRIIFYNKLCSVDECANKIQKNGVCIKHGAVKICCSVDGCSNVSVNNRVCIKHGAIVKHCSVDGCVNKTHNTGLCVKHGAVLKRCSVDECANKTHKNSVCVKHGAFDNDPLLTYTSLENIKKKKLEEMKIQKLLTIHTYNHIHLYK